MSDLFAVIQNAMKYQGANATVDITLDNGSKYTGVIEKFNGTVLSVNGENISIKATTTEHLGFEGREEGISSHAVVLLEKI